MLFSAESLAQTQNITGKIIASNDVFGIHIMNISANKFTITDDDGTFIIPARLNDTITVSSVQYKSTQFVISDIIIQTQEVAINLEDDVNLLDQVTVGKILTGNLMSDVENSDVKRDINFYDVGIPGYTGPRKTISEQRLFEARSGSGLIPLNPIINWFSGRTKELKEQIEREEKNNAIDEAVAKFSELLFETNTLEASKQIEFFYFSADNPDFLPLSKTQNDIKMLQFLKDQLEAFKLQIEDD